jgi:7-cyano-7-deazaguanine reductase
MGTKKPLPKNLVKKAMNQPAPEIGQVAEGKKLKFLSEKAIKPSELKVFKFQSPKQRIQIETAEFSAVCPFSGLPDIAKVHIEYYPLTQKAIELKSLKYYLGSYRPVGVYQERVTQLIHKHLCDILGHKAVAVQTIYNTRGGIDVTCTEGLHVMNAATANIK